MMKEHLPLVGQIYVQVSMAIMFLIARVALARGMSHYLYVFYRQSIATLVITPFAYFLQRDQMSKLTLGNVGKISLLALMGITISQNFYYAGLSLTSSTLASTMNNLNPALTFVMATSLRLEKLDLWTRGGQAKVWGSLMCVAGATAMTLFKGPPITLQHKPSGLVLPVGVSATRESPDGRNWISGALLLAGSTWSWSACVIYQAWIARECPSQLTSTTVMLLTGTLQTAVVALLLERPSAWRLNWDLQLLAISYSAIFCTALGMFVKLWCVKVKGPVFATIFYPLSTALVAILEPLLFHVPLHWGSLAGMVVAIGGLYSVLWGKALEEETTVSADSTNSFKAAGSTEEPLLTQVEETI
uniref:WAT1-related protein n=1 Tax=Anthurium amnicola TaxID=1678845 RepID=A0A1D1XP42_9ARAE